MNNAYTLTPITDVNFNELQLGKEYQIICHKACYTAELRHSESSYFFHATYIDSRIPIHSVSSIFLPTSTADLKRKIEIHIETTEECIDNFGIPEYVKKILEQDIELYREILAHSLFK